MPQVARCRGGASDRRVRSDERLRVVRQLAGAVGMAGAAEQLEDRPSGSTRGEGFVH
jgi:hypothetical protein